jgi:RES domain-containing protein
VRVWRITRQPYARLDGEGARLNGGRWNREGVPVVYTSATLSLAALEYLVHVDVEDVPADLCAMRVELPADAAIEVVDPERLPEGWRSVEEHPECVWRGEEWARRGESLALQVPSAVIPTESNYLLNPRHPDMARVRLVNLETFAFDRRLLA